MTTGGSSTPDGDAPRRAPRGCRSVSSRGSGWAYPWPTGSTNSPTRPLSSSPADPARRPARPPGRGGRRGRPRGTFQGEANCRTPLACSGRTSVYNILSTIPLVSIPRSVPSTERRADMKVAVLGAGAIGAYVGAALHRAGADVHLIARGPHLAAMRQHGVQVLSPRGDFTARAHATDDPADDRPGRLRLPGPQGQLVRGVRAADPAPAARAPRRSSPPRTASPGGTSTGSAARTTATVSRASTPTARSARCSPPERAVGCVVYAATELEGPGVVRHLEGTRFSIGEPDRTVSARCAAFSEAMVAGGLKCPVEPDLRNDIWIKLLGNIAFNPISALARATMAADLPPRRHPRRSSRR